MRKSAAEYIRELEARIARLERTAASIPTLDQIKSEVEREGLSGRGVEIALRRIENDLKVIEAKKILDEARAAIFQAHQRVRRMNLRPLTDISALYKAMGIRMGENRKLDMMLEALDNAANASEFGGLENFNAEPKVILK